MDNFPETQPQQNNGIAHAFFMISYYLGFAAWVFFAVFLIGLFVKIDVVTFIGWMGAAASIALSVILEEISNRLYGNGRGVVGILVIITSIICLVLSIYGYIVQDYTVIAAAVIVLLLVSFVPGILDSTSRKVQTRPYMPSGSGESYGVGSLEVFGVPSPKTPPAIVQESGQKYLDEDMPVSVDPQVTEEIKSEETETIGEEIPSSMPSQDAIAVEQDTDGVLAPSDDSFVTEAEDRVEESIAEEMQADQGLTVGDFISTLTVGEIMEMIAAEGE